MSKVTVINKSIHTTASKNQKDMEVNPDIAELLGIDQDSEVKTISSDFHTLFIENDTMSPGSIVIPMEVLSELTAGEELPFDIESIGESISIEAPEVSYKQYTMFVGDLMQSDDKKESYYKLLKELNKAESNDKIKIYVSSNGGSVEEGIQLMKHINSNFLPENITTILDPKGYSMGSFMFLIGSKRIISEYSKIMLHNYSMIAGGKGGEIKDYVDFYNEIFTDLARKKYVDTGYITEEEFNQFLIGKEWWFNCKTMCERKIATHVSTETGEVLTVEEYLEKYHPTEQKDVQEKPTPKKSTKKMKTPKKN